MEGTGQFRGWRRVVVGLTVLFLCGCDPEQPVERFVNVEVLDDGGAIFLGAPGYPEDAVDSGVDWQVETQVCLDQAPSTCVRIHLGTGRVEESSDGGATWRRVLDVDDSEPWLAHLVTYSYADPDIEAFDVARTSDDRVLVAMGRLGAIERSVDGGWSVTDSTLRHLDPSPALGVVAAFGVLMLSWSWHRLKETLVFADPNRRFFTASAAGTISSFLAVPAIVFTTAAMYFEGGYGWFFLAAIFLGSPLAVVSLIITITTAIRCFGVDRRASLLALRNSVAVVGAFAAMLFGIERLWSHAVVGWDTAIVLAAIVATGALTFAARPVEIELPHPAPVAADAP